MDGQWIVAKRHAMVLTLIANLIGFVLHNHNSGGTFTAALRQLNIHGKSARRGKSLLAHPDCTRQAINGHFSAAGNRSHVITKQHVPHKGQ